MSSYPKYLVAKYVSDLRRQEPRNIGVVVWHKGQTAFKFMEAGDAAAFVNSKSTYARWVEFWTDLLGRSELDIPGLPTAKRSDAAFLDAIIATQQASYLLEDRGEVIAKVPTRKLNGVAEYLFNEMVTVPKKKDKPSAKEQRMLHGVCEKLFEDIGLAGHANFKSSHGVVCEVGNTEQEFRFSYAQENSHLQSVYHRVTLTSATSVRAASFMFEYVKKSRQLTGEQCAALVMADNEVMETKAASSAVELLRGFATVINVANYEVARGELAAFSENAASD